MEKKIITCPNCKSRLAVKEEVVAANKLITCPACKFKAAVSVYMMGRSAQGGDGASDDATQLPGSSPMQAKTDVGRLRVVKTGQVLPLRLGPQVIGRHSASSKADLQIGNANYQDPYMSRQHVRIEVVQTPQGIQHHMEEIGSSNIIQLNGKDIQRGDLVILRFGDKLTLGETEVILEETDNEATILK